MLRRLASRLRPLILECLLALPLVGCGHRSGARPGAEGPPEKWIVASPMDSIGHGESRNTSSGPLERPGKFDEAGISIQGDSMVVEIVDPEGRSTAWNSWDCAVAGGSLPRCKLDGILISQVAPGETAPYIAYTLSSPVPGKYQIRIRALTSFEAHLDVHRERNGWSPWCGASDTAQMHRGRLASWVVQWSPSSAESCWVHLSGPGGRRALIQM